MNSIMHRISHPSLFDGLGQACAIKAHETKSRGMLKIIPRNGHRIN